MTIQDMNDLVDENELESVKFNKDFYTGDLESVTIKTATNSLTLCAFDVETLIAELMTDNKRGYISKVDHDQNIDLLNLRISGLNDQLIRYDRLKNDLMDDIRKSRDTANEAKAELDLFKATYVTDDVIPTVRDDEETAW